MAFQLTATRRAARAVLRKAPEWISLIPIIGPILEATIETRRALRKKAADPRREEAMGTGSTVDQVRTLLSEAPMEPRLIVMEHMDAADAEEMSGAWALMQRLDGTRTLLLCTSRSTAGRPPGAVLDLLREAERLGRGDAVELGSEQGGPERPGPGPGAGLELGEAEHDLLREAAEFGPEFAADALAARMGMEEIDLHDRLAGLVRHGILVLLRTEEVEDTFRDVYAFRDTADVARFSGGAPGN